MKKFHFLTILLILLSCTNGNNVVKKPNNFTDNSFYCDTSGFKLSDYFPIEQINRFQSEIDKFKYKDSVNGFKDSTILFVGSSSIRKWKSLESSFKPLPVINRGFGGSTFAELIYYINELVFKYNPKIVVVYEGDNDQYFMRPGEIFKCACYFEKKLHETLPQTKLFYMSIKPSPARKTKLRDMAKTNQFLNNYADTTKNTFYINVWDVCFKDDLIRSDIFKNDSLHLNSKGYQYWRNIIFPIMEKKYIFINQ